MVMVSVSEETSPARSRRGRKFPCFNISLPDLLETCRRSDPWPLLDTMPPLNRDNIVNRNTCRCVLCPPNVVHGADEPGPIAAREVRLDC